MGFKCFVAGCKSGYESQVKLDKLNNTKHPSLFKPPKDPGMLEIWRQVIPRADRKLRDRDRVCELHFPEKDIIRHFETKLYDGKVFKLERQFPLLKKGAIPVLYPNLPKYSESLKKMIAELNFPSRIKTAELKATYGALYGELLKKPGFKGMRFDETTDDTGDTNTEMDKSVAEEDVHKSAEMANDFEENTSICADNTIVCADNTIVCADNTIVCVDNTIVCADSIIASPDNMSIYTEDASMGTEDTNMSVEDTNANNGNTEVERLTFNHILKNLASISKPSISWAVSAHDKFVVCAKWNENYMPEKRVIIDCDLNIKVFVKDREVGSFKNIGFNSISDISTILHFIDN